MGGRGHYRGEGVVREKEGGRTKGSQMGEREEGGGGGKAFILLNTGPSVLTSLSKESPLHAASL